MNDFKAALAKWDVTAEEFKARISRQVKIITNLSEQHQVLMSSLTEICDATDLDDVKLMATEALKQCEAIQQTNYPNGASGE